MRHLCDKEDGEVGVFGETSVTETKVNRPGIDSGSLLIGFVGPESLVVGKDQ